MPFSARLLSGENEQVMGVRLQGEMKGRSVMCLCVEQGGDAK